MFECVCVCVYTNDETTERRRERVKGKKKKKKASRADQYELLAESSAGRILHFSFIRPSIHPSIQSPGHLLFSFLFPPTPKSREIQKEKRKQKREKLNSAQAPSSTPSSQTAQDDRGPAALLPSLEMSTWRTEEIKIKRRRRRRRRELSIQYIHDSAINRRKKRRRKKSKKPENYSIVVCAIAV